MCELTMDDEADDFLIIQYVGDASWEPRFVVDGAAGFTLNDKSANPQFVVDGAGNVTNGGWTADVIGTAYMPTVIKSDSKSAQWFTPTGADDDIIIFRAGGAGTITEVECYTTGGTNTIINVYNNAADVSNGNFTCGAGAWASDIALTNTTLADDYEVQVDTISISGTPSKVFVQVWYTE